MPSLLPMRVIKTLSLSQRIYNYTTPTSSTSIRKYNMSSKQAVVTSGAPAPPPFLSQAIKSGGFVFCSGSIGMDTTGAFAQGDIGARTAQALKNLTAVLDAAGSSIDEVVKVNVFITDMANFGTMNAVYEKVFTKDPKPARTCVAVHQLPLGTDVEIECTAALLGAPKL